MRSSSRSGTSVLALSDKWAPLLISKPEAGMGYQVATIVLRDGRKFEKAVIVGGYVTRIAGLSDIPFSEGEIADIVVTNEPLGTG
jgi:hypothetical protein